MNQGLITGNKIIANLIVGSDPFLISRLGGVESDLINYLSGSQKTFIKLKNASLVKKTWVNAGIWPPTMHEIRKFQIEYLYSLSNSDAFALWGDNTLTNEKYILDSIGKKSLQFPLRVLDPLQLSSEMNAESVWTNKLLDLNVLIVSNFAKSIQLQYTKHSHKGIHKHNFLPRFNLHAINPPLTQGLIFWNGKWSKNLEDFKKDIQFYCVNNKIDVALISAGSYGLPIGSYLKSIDVKSIYMGGALQLMFGIMGQRWTKSQNVLDQKNENWLEKPLEKPPFGFRIIEKKSYW
jgi:hypothetical protein